MAKSAPISNFFCLKDTLKLHHTNYKWCLICIVKKFLTSFSQILSPNFEQFSLFKPQFWAVGGFFDQKKFFLENFILDDAKIKGVDHKVVFRVLGGHLG